jgi:hypothetical protein
MLALIWVYIGMYLFLPIAAIGWWGTPRSSMYRKRERPVRPRIRSLLLIVLVLALDFAILSALSRGRPSARLMLIDIVAVMIPMLIAVSSRCSVVDLLVWSLVAAMLGVLSLPAVVFA